MLGLPAAFALASLALGSLAVAALAIPAGRLPAGRGARGLPAIRAGIGYVRRTPTAFSTMVMDFSAMLFGFPLALFPAIAITVFGVGPAGIGALVSSIAVGAVLASVLSGRLSAMHRKGVGVIALFLVWGAAITLFGLATFSFTIALVFLKDITAQLFREPEHEGAETIALPTQWSSKPLLWRNAAPIDASSEISARIR